MLRSKKNVVPQPGFVGRRGDMFQPVVYYESSYKGRRGDMPMLNKNRTYRHSSVNDPDYKSKKQMHFDDDVDFEDMLFDGAKDYKDYARIRDKYYEGRK
jgi:hypothetical protein